MMTEATPITTPISVRMERSLLPHSDCSASLKASISFIILLCPRTDRPDSLPDPLPRPARSWLSSPALGRLHRSGPDGRLPVLTNQPLFGTCPLARTGHKSTHSEDTRKHARRFRRAAAFSLAGSTIKDTADDDRSAPWRIFSRTA